MSHELSDLPNKSLLVVVLY